MDDRLRAMFLSFDWEVDDINFETKSCQSSNNHMASLV
jgi:hypothetical protein